VNIYLSFSRSLSTTGIIRFPKQDWKGIYSLEYTEIPKVFFTPHTSSDVNRSPRSLPRRSLSLERNNKGNNDIQGHCCDVIRSHWCEPSMTSLPTVKAMYSNNDLGRHCCNSVHQQMHWFPLFRNNEFQQWPCFLLLPQCVTTMTPGHTNYLVPRKK
jgi:hypothetical protein